MMRDSGMALMGSGSGSGENRVCDAIRTATESPLLNNYDLKKATKVLVNVTCSASKDGLKMEELSLLEKKIGEALGVTENYKKGIVFDDDPGFGDRLDVTIIATGVDMMGAVPEDYHDQDREPSARLSEEEEPGVDQTEPTEPSGIKKVISRIKNEVSRLYDETDDIV